MKNQNQIIYFGCNLEWKGYSNFVRRISVLFFCIVFLIPFILKAQMPADRELNGDWFFDHAEVQEKPAGSENFQTIQTFSKNQFLEKVYSKKIPMHLFFIEGKFLAYTAGATWFMKVFACVMDDNEIVFRDAMEAQMNLHDEENLETLKIESYPIVTRYTNLTVNGDLMNMQYHYFFGNGNTEGEVIITIYYYRQQ